MPGQHCLLFSDDFGNQQPQLIAGLSLPVIKGGYFGNTALAIPQRILEWTSLGWKRFMDP